MKTDRRSFIAGTTAFALAPAFAVRGCEIRTPMTLDAKRMAIHDGPSMRTTFFVKGCPLHCVRCHNPESIRSERQVARFQHLCRHCKACTMDEATCPIRALGFYGKPAAIEELLSVAEMWLPDFKCDDEATHLKCTGFSNEVIKRNLERFVAAKAKLEVRCLVVSGFTEDMAARYAYLESIGISRKDVVELEYLDYARSKYQALGVPDTMPEKRERGKGKGEQGVKAG